MPLNNYQFNVVKDHLENQTTGECPMCDATEWTIGDLGYQHLPSGYLPVVSVTCSTCFFVATYSAQQLGIVQ